MDDILVLLDDEVDTGPPEVSVPTVVLNYLWRRDAGDTGDGTRIGTYTTAGVYQTSIIPNGSGIDWFVSSGSDYEYRAEAVGENGTSAFSEWTS